MPASNRDWKSITKDTKEKYNLYLCSREWSVLKEAVRKRSGGVCERCNRNPMEACHHLTYANKYAEELDDLQAICKPCHEFTHGKSEVDPASRESSFEEYATRVFTLGYWPACFELVTGFYEELNPTVCVISEAVGRFLNDKQRQLYLLSADAEEVPTALWKDLELRRLCLIGMQKQCLRSDVCYWFTSGCPGVDGWKQYEEIVHKKLSIPYPRDVDGPWPLKPLTE